MRTCGMDDALLAELAEPTAAGAEAADEEEPKTRFTTFDWPTGMRMIGPVLMRLPPPLVTTSLRAGSRGLAARRCWKNCWMMTA